MAVSRRITPRTGAVEIQGILSEREMRIKKDQIARVNVMGKYGVEDVVYTIQETTAEVCR